jgi:hypothetical protein
MCFAIAIVACAVPWTWWASSSMELGRDRGQGQVRLRVSGSWHSGTIQRCSNLNGRVHSTLPDLHNQESL